MGKNLKEIQSMIDGRYGRKIQVGYTGKTQREEGEKWIDGNETEWEIVNGKRKQITNVPARGFDKCSDCNKLIFKQRDEDTYNRMGRCFYCQINFEVHLKSKGTWDEWVKDQEMQRWKIIKKEFTSILKEMKEQSEKQFDPTIAHAVGNDTQQKNREEIKREIGN